MQPRRTKRVSRQPSSSCALTAGATLFVAGVIDCDGTSVRANVINVEPDPEHVHTGMKVKLATYSLGTDDNGTEAIGFGYEPVG